MEDNKKLRLIDITVNTKIFEIKNEIERRDKNIIGDNQYKYHSRNELVKVIEVLEDIQNVIEMQ